MFDLEELAHAIVAAFHFPLQPLRDGDASLFVHVGDVMEVMHVVGEPPHVLRDFLLSVAVELEEFALKHTDGFKLPGDPLQVHFRRMASL